MASPPSPPAYSPPDPIQRASTTVVAEKGRPKRTYKTSVPVHQLGRFAAPTDCPVCGEINMTSLKYKIGGFTQWVLSIFMCYSTQSIPSFLLFHCDPVPSPSIPYASWSLIPNLFLFPLSFRQITLITSMRPKKKNWYHKKDIKRIQTNLPFQKQRNGLRRLRRHCNLLLGPVSHEQLQEYRATLRQSGLWCVTRDVASGATSGVCGGTSVCLGWVGCEAGEGRGEEGVGVSFVLGFVLGVVMVLWLVMEFCAAYFRFICCLQLLRQSSRLGIS